MVKITKEEKQSLKKLSDLFMDAQRALDVASGNLTQAMLVLYQKYKVNKLEFGINPDVGEFVKHPKK